MKLTNHFDDYEQFSLYLAGVNYQTCLISKIRSYGDRASQKTVMDVIDKLQPSQVFLFNQSTVFKNNPNYNIKYLTENTKSFIETIYSFLIKHPDITTFIDIAALNINVLLELLFLSRHVLKDTKLVLYYMTPKDYGDYEYGFYCDPTCIPFAPGLQTIGKKDVLVILSGYEGDGMLSLIRYMEPSTIQMVTTVPPSEGGFNIRNADTAQRVIAQYLTETQIEHNSFTIPGNDIHQGIDALEKHLCQTGLISNNIYLAPMSNKLTTLAAFFFWEKHPEIQLLTIKGKRQSTENEERGITSVYLF